MKINIIKNNIGQKRIIRLKRRTININNRNYKNYIYIYANKNYRITEDIIKSMKNDLLVLKGLTNGKLLKFFLIRILIVPNKLLTSKGILVRMGKGKAKVTSKAIYLTKDCNCIELIPLPNISIPKILTSKLLKKFTNKYSFLSYKYLL